MIQLIRVDDRLLHGQVAYSWKAKLQYDAIVLVSDEASKDDLRKATLKMCCPPGVKLATRSVEEGANLLNNPKIKDKKVFVICQDVNTLYRLLPHLKEKTTLNIGGSPKKEGRNEFAPAVYLNEDELAQLDELVKAGYNVEVQQVPESKMQLYKALRKGLL